MERMTNDTPYWKERLSAHDTINRQVAIDAIQKDRETSWKDLENDDVEYRNGCDDGYAYSMQIISELPSVERKRGKWISESTGEPVELIEGRPLESCKCSVCGKWLIASDEYGVYGYFCPYCGSFNGGEE